MDIGPLRISRTDTAGALRAVDLALRAGPPRFFCFCEASLLANVICDTAVRQAVCGASAVFADGVALVALARLHGQRLPERIPGPSFLLAACQYGLTRGWRHFFYGGAPGVAERLAERLAKRYPGLAVAGTHSPPFRELTQQEEVAVKEMIESSDAHLLWVCLGSPKQELWVAARVGRINVPVMLPVGAAFDFHAGHRPWAPAWVRRIGLEWVFRTFTGGKRTFLRNVRCVSTVAALIVTVAAQRLLARCRVFKSHPKVP